MVFLKISGDIDDLENRIACMVGSCANQDGRSASLTAPNGPSQQAAIRYSLKMGGITPEHVTAVECHGTGTALGDPIEVGSIMAVMEDEREPPLPHTSAKSNCGHLEGSAGIAGLTKCLAFLNKSTAPPNVHLRALNAHLTSSGFPQLFEQENVDTFQNAGHTGVSSFGFGGTNSRADIYIQCNSGPRKRTTYDLAKLEYIITVCPQCMGNMCWKCSAAIPSNAPKERHVCSLIRDEFADYQICSNCYAGEAGEFRHGEEIEDTAHRFYEGLPEVRVSLTGTWSAWSEFEDMAQEDDGAYVAWIPIGDTRWEAFQLVVNGNSEQRIHPVCDKASPSARIEGPDAGMVRMNWLIDGLRDMAPAGTYYKVKFYWKNEQKSISWEKVPPDAIPPSGTEGLIKTEYRHRLFITGTWVNWEFREMAPSDSKAGVYCTTFKCRRGGKEEFKFVRDKDWSQAIYPGAGDPTLLRGPDDASHGKNFSVHGHFKEEVAIEVHLLDAQVSLKASSLSLGERVWKSAPLDAPQHIYYITGGFNNWSFTPMTPDTDANGAGVQKYRLAVGEAWEEAFQIVLDRDIMRSIHPVAPDAIRSGEIMVVGPDDNGQGKNWLIQGEDGMEAEIVLDLDAIDRRKVVTWTMHWNEECQNYFENCADPTLKQTIADTLQKYQSMCFAGKA